MADESGWRLAWAFPDPSDSFAHGFVAGEIRERMKKGDPIETQIVVEAQGIIESMTKAFGWTAAYTPVEGGGWVIAWLDPPETDGDRYRRAGHRRRHE